MPNLEDFLNHPIESLEKALHIRKQIESLQKQLSELFGSHPPSLDAVPSEPLTVAKVKKKKGGMSAEGKARIAAAQKARWAKVKAEKAPTSSGPAKASAAPKKKGGMSAEGRARIAAAQKARWAKFKAAKK